ncbi:winged helix DNA-binding domain-containing protein [Chryseolinea sp. T2]|uniref:winged helix DNA-binding domain-containing protein n=1 Tax=Chryseolinea sp. T2 TaxID=3129255 RepID=UPI00307780BB
MTIADILKQRLKNQWLVESPAQSPSDVVRQLLAVQAQDYLGSMWAIGQRLPGSDETIVERSIANGSLIRTWPMRGTLHLVAAEDARWLCDFLAARVLPKTRSVYQKAGLDSSVFKKSERLIIKALEKEPVLTRDEMYERLEKGGIATGNSRGLHITGYMAITGRICLGPRKGKQHTIVLRDEWLRTAKEFQPDDIQQTLAERYFAGHGPATVQDFAWWSGLTLTEARQAIDKASSALRTIKVKDITYYETSDADSKKTTKFNVTHLLPAYDEFTVAYKDRTLLLPQNQRDRSSMEVLSPVMSVNGALMGTWSRSLVKSRINFQLKPFGTITAAQRTKINAQIKKYAAFVGVHNSTIEVLS